MNENILLKRKIESLQSSCVGPQSYITGSVNYGKTTTTIDANGKPVTGQTSITESKKWKKPPVTY